VYARIHRDRGVDLRLSTSVSEWIADGDRVEAVALSDGTREEVDLVLVAVGIEPELALAGDLGLRMEAGGVAVDETLRADGGVYCAGDIAAHLHPVFGRHLRVEHWQVARKQGQAIGQAIVGGSSAYEELPWFWSDQYDVNLQYVGSAAGFDRTVWKGRPEWRAVLGLLPAGRARPGGAGGQRRQDDPGQPRADQPPGAGVARRAGRRGERPAGARPVHLEPR